jgi:hypothetical protein
LFNGRFSAGRMPPPLPSWSHIHMYKSYLLRLVSSPVPLIVSACLNLLHHMESVPENNHTIISIQYLLSRVTWSGILHISQVFSSFKAEYFYPYKPIYRAWN